MPEPRTFPAVHKLAVAGLLLTLGCHGGSDHAPHGQVDGGRGSSDAAANPSDASSTKGLDGGQGDGGDAGNGHDAATCGGSPFEAQPVEVNVLVLLDRSGSMSNTPSGFTMDKWAVTTGALETALAGVQDKISFGLQLFPIDAACGMPPESDSSLSVALGPGKDTLPHIMTTLGGASPGGGTPTAAALKRALLYFTQGAGAALKGESYVLIATDGGPNCNASLTCDASTCVSNMEGRCATAPANCCDVSISADAPLNCLDDGATLAQVQALKTAGISTFVVGIPGSELFATSLDSFAQAGGVPNTSGPHKYFAVDAPEALTQVLTSITTSLVKSCELQLDSVPPDLQKLNVEVEGKTIPRDGADGWKLDQSTNPPTVVIQGSPCTRIETQGVQSVKVVYGCPTITIF